MRINHGTGIIILYMSHIPLPTHSRFIGERRFLKKQLLVLLLLISLLATPAHAAENSMEHFTPNASGLSYRGQFSDVSGDSVFYESVAALYEYGLSVGKADGAFGLQDNVTVSQLLIFAGRVRSLYRTGDPESGPAAHITGGDSTICLPYLRYLKAEQVLGNELDSLLLTPATRAQVAHVLANVLPKEVLPTINQDIITEAYATRSFIVDVDEYTPYQQDILYLYHCGISVGCDDRGTFLPDAPITRGSLAVMLTRLTNPALRIQLRWQSPVPDVSALTLADLVEPGEYIASPVTDAEMDESVRHMLSNGSSELILSYPDITKQDARKLLHQALRVAKTYTEQGYNRVEGTFTVGNLIHLIFSASGADSHLTQDYREAALDAAKSVHDKLWQEGHLYSGMTELQKARIYYIWICENCIYDDGAADDSISHLPYSLFRYGKAVCDGYTGAYNLLLKLEGIACSSVLTEEHIWTSAVLDGAEYHIDTTWGDTEKGASSLYFAMTPAFSEVIHDEVY